MGENWDRHGQKNSESNRCIEKRASVIFKCDRDTKKHTEKKKMTEKQVSKKKKGDCFERI
jgi:hypothetical protein